MSVIRATVQNGKIVGDAPADWPEGDTVELVRVEDRFRDIEAVQGHTPDAIEDWLKWYDSLEPLTLTPEDEERIAADRRERKEWFSAHAEERDRQLRERFE